MSADADRARALVARAGEVNGWNVGCDPTTDQAIALAGVYAQLALAGAFERLEAAEAEAAQRHDERMAAADARAAEGDATADRIAADLREAREAAGGEPATALDDLAMITAIDDLTLITEALGVKYGSAGWLAAALDVARARRT